MLGMIHRSVLGIGPGHFRKYFRRAVASRHPEGRESIHRHNLQLQSHRCCKFLQILAHSALGLVDIYNLLPAYVVAAPDVHLFQKRLQEVLRSAVGNIYEWECLFSPRRNLHDNALRKMLCWEPAGCTTSIGGTAPAATIATNKNASCVSAWLRFAS